MYQILKFFLPSFSPPRTCCENSLYGGLKSCLDIGKRGTGSGHCVNSCPKKIIWLLGLFGWVFEDYLTILFVLLLSFSWIITRELSKRAYLTPRVHVVDGPVKLNFVYDQ